jgi:hypothetical protein
LPEPGKPHDGNRIATFEFSLHRNRSIGILARLTGQFRAFDFRQDPPTVILVNLVSTDWSEAILHAESFTEFMDQRRRGEKLRWRGGHA